MLGSSNLSILIKIQKVGGLNAIAANANNY